MRPKNARNMEIFEKKPILVGGDPNDPINKVLVNRQEHIKLVNYWNKVVRDLTRSKS